MRGRQGCIVHPRLWKLQVPRSWGRNEASSWCALGVGRDAVGKYWGQL